MTFSGVITIGKSGVPAKGSGRRLKIKVTKVKTHFSHFRTVTPVWIHIWRWKESQSLMWHRRGVLLFFNVIRQISSSHGTKIGDFDPNWAFPDCNSSSNSPIPKKWFTKLEVGGKRCPIVFQGHLPNFKVTQDKKISILTRIGRFRTVTPVRIHRYLRNDVQNLK